MGLIIGIFFIIILVFIFTVIGSWLYTRHSIKYNYSSFKNLDESLIKKYNLFNSSLIDKKRTWIDLIIWNLIIYLFEHVLLIFSFLIFKYENNSLFVASIVVIVLGNAICLFINFLISYFYWKNSYYKNKEQITTNLNEFIEKMSLSKYVEQYEIVKTNIYNFRDKIYQKKLNKSLSKLKFKSDGEWNIKHYIIFLKYSDFFIFNLKRSNIQYTNISFNNICDQTLNNLMLKINNHYILKTK